ncbi:NIC-domain-containing protein [Lophium mytilinum]|uniref:NIC-domain-containing protein n=1 Tax=Lophium mytilinum TaxID=390894 RepID=A0A6A6R722_9PEZI|nr:NIC-domain-containing protein [Lophium mytilinum]
MFSNLGITTGAPPFGSNPAPTSGQSGSSLFGNTGTSSAATTGGLFSNLGGAQQANSSTAPSTGGLFARVQPANTAAQTASATPGLFSNLGGATSQAPPASSAGGLFGGLSGLGASTNQPQQPATGASTFGGFGNLGASTNPQPNNASQQQAQEQDPSLTESTNPTRKNAHFDQLLERGKKRTNQANGASQFGGLPTLQLGLGDIARKVRNLGTGGPSASQAAQGDDSRAHYVLAASGISTGRTLRDLNQFGSQVGLGVAGATSAPLDSDVDSYLSNLQSQSTLALIQEGLEQSKRDFDTFLEDNVQMEWDAQRKRIYEHFGLGRQSENLAASAAPGQSTRGAFGRSSRRGNGLGASTAASGGMSFGATGMRSVIGAPAFSGRGAPPQDFTEKTAAGTQAGPEDRVVRDKQERFATSVRELNQARLVKRVYPVLTKFADVERPTGIDSTQKLVDAYNALIEITEENANVTNVTDEGAVRERSFTRAYLAENSNSADSLAIRKAILNGSRKYLEKSYLEQVSNEIDKNPVDANPGGIPSIVAKIRAYIRLKSSRKELGADSDHLARIGDNEDWPWVMVFHLLRGGLRQEAAAYVNDQKHQLFFKANDRQFIAGISQYAASPDRKLTGNTQQNLSHIYAQRSRIGPEHASDPYRMACYKIVGRCELNRRSLDRINQNMDDWVWLQFNLARESSRIEESAGESFGLDELRASISEIGQRHFSAGSDGANGFGVFFFLQILAGMFEQAISYLYQHSYVSAVHFAIALDFYGLLRVASLASAGTEILTFTTRNLPQLNFGQMVGYYTRDFRAAKAEAAADYLTLLCLNADLDGEAGREQARLCHEALRELVLETREFAELLGDIRGNGSSIPGAIEQRLPLIKIEDRRSFMAKITVQAAKIADDSGRTTDAVLLYHLSEEFNNVITILNRAVSEALSVDLGQEALRLEPLRPRANAGLVEGQQQPPQPGSSLSLAAIDDPIQLATSMNNMYEQNEGYYSKISRENRQTIAVLLELSKAKKQVEEGKWAPALDTMIETDLLPLRAQGRLSEIRSSATNFGNFAPEAARNVGHVLMWAIICCGKLREYLLGGAYEDPTKRKLADQCLQQAKDLMVFAGLIRYKLPPRVFEVLARAGQDVGVY